MTLADTEGAAPDTRDMLVVHTSFRREFRLAPGLVRGVAEGDLARSRIVADHLEWLLGMLHHHHEGEDRLIWPLLLERVPAEVAPTVHVMESQHADISESTEQVLAALPDWRKTAATGLRDDLAARLDRVRGLLEEHLALEEREVLPLIEKALSRQEWDRLGQEGIGTLDRKDVPLAFGGMMYEGDPATIKTMLSHAPLVPRLLMPRLAPRAFARYSRRVHGTATP